MFDIIIEFRKSSRPDAQATPERIRRIQAERYKAGCGDNDFNLQISRSPGRCHNRLFDQYFYAILLEDQKRELCHKFRCLAFFYVSEFFSQS